MNRIISLTSIPSRVHKISSVIDSLLNQTIQTEIHISLPKYCPRTEDSLEEIPDFLNHERITWSLIDDDPGPILKLVGALLYGQEEQIITVDDDVHYPPKFVETFLRFSRTYDNAALCFRGRNITSTQYNNCSIVDCNSIAKPQKVDIITGTWGAFYRRDWFDVDELMLYTSEENLSVDDMVISRYLDDKNVESYCLPFEGIEPSTALQFVDSLWAINQSADHNNKELGKR